MGPTESLASVQQESGRVRVRERDMLTGADFWSPAMAGGKGANEPKKPKRQ